MNPTDDPALLRAILDFNATIAGSANLDDLFQRVTAFLPKVLSFRRASVYRYEDSSRMLTLTAADKQADRSLLTSLESFPLEGSYVEDAALRRKPVLLAVDRRSFPQEAVSQISAAGIRSVLVLPLTAEGRFIGSFHVGREEEDPLPPEKVELVSQIATQLGLALRSTLSVEALRKREEEQRQLIAITNVLIGELEPSQMFLTIGEHLRSLFPIVSYGILLYNSEKGMFDRGIFLSGGGDVQSIEPIPRSGTLLQIVCDRKTAVLVSPKEVAGILRRFGSLMAAGGERDLSGVLLPLHGRTKNIIGVVAATRPASSPFRPEDLPFLNQLAVQISLAMENMQSHQETRRLRNRLEAEGRYLKEEIDDAFDTQSLLYASEAIAGVMSQIKKAAETESTVLLVGETGTGKELFARTIHAMSRVASRALVKVNCGAIPAGLLESTLFGHERGAFTGAVKQHMGLFELAHEGTIFLDEIGDLPVDMQVKLLRVLQEGEIMRVGGREQIHVRVRVIAATNRPLEVMVKQGTFRADLYYRLAVFPIVIPPLRERPEDIPLLATFFVQKYAQRYRKPVRRISAEGLAILRAYEFPGNVRELENLIERAVVLCDGSTLGIESLPLTVAGGSARPGPGKVRRPQSEKERLLVVLRECNWIIEGNRGAARRLNLKPSTLRSKMLQLGIRRPPA